MPTSVSAFPDHLTAASVAKLDYKGESADFSVINIFQQKEDQNPRHFQIFQKSSRTEI